MLYALGIIGLFILILVIRALMFNPKERQAVASLDVTVNEDRAVDNFQAMIRCRTISYEDAGMKDESAFDDFRALLDERYPNVSKRCTKQFIEPAGVIYHWKGKGGDMPWVLMSHYDVVPVEETMWAEEPFSAVLKDGEIWGRGTIDTKSTLLGVMEAAETLAAQGFTPKNDVYLCFGGDEELSGASAIAMVKWFEEQGISPTVIDEGGAIVDGVFPGVSGLTAVIGTGEKGITNIGFTLRARAATRPPRRRIRRLA